jgi:hypothetical protein
MPAQSKLISSVSQCCNEIKGILFGIIGDSWRLLELVALPAQTC